MVFPIRKILVAFAFQLVKPDVFFGVVSAKPRSKGHRLVDREVNQCFVSRLNGVSRVFGRDLEEESEANDAEMDEPQSFVSWLAGGLALSWFFQNVSLNTAQASCIPMMYQVSFFASCPCVGRCETKLFLFEATTTLLVVVPCVSKLQTDNDDACCCLR